MGLLLKLPEYLLIAVALCYWVSAGHLWNPIAISLIVILILQIIIRNRVVGLLIPSLLILISFYMLLALMSEFSEFSAFSADAKQFLLVGLSVFITSMIASGVMIYKYSRDETE